MKDQIIKLLEVKRLNPAKFADTIGVQRSSISHILSGRNKPSYDFIHRILEKFSDIDAHWLITGKGEMFKGKNPNISPGSLFGTEEKHINPEPVSTASAGNLKTQQADSLQHTTSDPHANKDILAKVTDVNIDFVLVFYSDNTVKRYIIRD